MRSENAQSTRYLAAAASGLAAALLLLAGGAAAEQPGPQVTAVVGAPTTGSGQALGSHSELADREKIAVGEDEACSILVDDDALIELCEDTEVELLRDPTSGRRIVSVNSGSIRIVVEPRLVEERIEIHTPAAVAVLMGTIVHVRVDPTSRETTLTSKESKFQVTSPDPAVKGSIVVTDLEQVVMRPGEAPPQQARRLEPEEIDELGGCLLDFHAVAGDIASHALQLSAAERIAAEDGSEFPWNPEAAGPAAPLGDPAQDIVEPAEVCSPIDCAGVEQDEGRTQLPPDEYGDGGNYIDHDNGPKGGDGNY